MVLSWYICKQQMVRVSLDYSILIFCAYAVIITHLHVVLSPDPTCHEEQGLVSSTCFLGYAHTISCCISAGHCYVMYHHFSQHVACVAMEITTGERPVHLLSLIFIFFPLNYSAYQSNLVKSPQHIKPQIIRQFMELINGDIIQHRCLPFCLPPANHWFSAYWRWTLH